MNDRTKFVLPETEALKHGELQKIESMAREGFSAIKQVNLSKGASLSQAATISFRFVDEDALRGAKSIESGKRGHESVHGNEEEKRKRWALYQEEVDRLYQLHSTWSWENIKSQAAKNLGVCSKTIQRRCKSPKKS